MLFDLSGVLVTLSFADLEFTAYTNDDGRFEFNDLPPISVSVVLTVYGYIDTAAM